jgi:hypothetical protein
MTIKDVKEQLPSIQDAKQRADMLKRLFQLMSPMSYKTLMVFQRDWDGRRPYAEFVEAQNREILMCIDLEVSDIGKLTRGALQLQEISLETELPVEP